MLILLLTNSNKLKWREPYTAESRVGANDYRVKMGSKTKTYYVNMLKKYISREPDVEGNAVPIDDTDGTTVAVDGDTLGRRPGAGRATRLGRLPPERRGL